MITVEECFAVRKVLESTKGYEGLRQEFPRFADAIDALPNESKFCYVNIILREIFKDVLVRAKENIAAAMAYERTKK